MKYACVRACVWRCIWIFVVNRWMFKNVSAWGQSRLGSTHYYYYNHHHPHHHHHHHHHYQHRYHQRKPRDDFFRGRFHLHVGADFSESPYSYSFWRCAGSLWIPLNKQTKMLIISPDPPSSRRPVHVRQTQINKKCSLSTLTCPCSLHFNLVYVAVSNLDAATFQVRANLFKCRVGTGCVS